jgi:UDP:flavonoid glycosyltransferase YjiC (YdhE family)
MVPARSWTAEVKQSLLRFLVNNLVFGESTRLLSSLVTPYGIPAYQGNILNIGLRNADLYLQSGTPGFEYPREDITANFRFAGPLLPYKKGATDFSLDYERRIYEKVILVTQGTFEKDPGKLLIPTLEAFKNSTYLVIATTGGSETDALRERFPERNVLILDFIDFDAVMPLSDVYVTNGGYGGVLMAINHALPVVAAGVHEGKLEITTRVGHFGIGIDLKTETPHAHQVRSAVKRVLSEPTYKTKVKKLSAEFRRFNSYTRCQGAIEALYNQKNKNTINESIK